MLLSGTNLLLFYLIIASTKGELGLEIIKNEEKIKTSVLYSMETRNGTNFSLECHVIDLKTGKYVDDQIQWQKKSYKMKFIEERKIIKGAEMKFIPALVENEGKYKCISRNYNLRKVIFVKVVPVIRKAQKYLNKRRKRFNGNVRESLSQKNSKISDEFRTNQGKNSIQERDSDQSDVKKNKLHGDNETQINPIRYHDGTTEIFRIGLGVSFGMLAVIGFYRIFKCWRTGTLGPVSNRARTTSTTPNNCLDTFDSNQTTITSTTANDGSQERRYPEELMEMYAPSGSNDRGGGVEGGSGEKYYLGRSHGAPPTRKI